MAAASRPRSRRTTAGCGPRATSPRRWKARSSRNELQRDPVVAIAQARGLGSVFEHVALVAFAARAMVFVARQDQQEVLLLLQAARDVVVEARPAGAALELGVRLEEREIAAGAHERALALL